MTPNKKNGLPSAFANPDKTVLAQNSGLPRTSSPLTDKDITGFAMPRSGTSSAMPRTIGTGSLRSF